MTLKPSQLSTVRYLTKWLKWKIFLEMETNDRHYQAELEKLVQKNPR